MADFHQTTVEGAFSSLLSGQQIINNVIIHTMVLAGIGNSGEIAGLLEQMAKSQNDEIVSTLLNGLATTTRKMGPPEPNGGPVLTIIPGGLDPN